MNTCEKMHIVVEQLSDEQLALLLPLALSMRDAQNPVLASTTSQAYQDWVSTENDIYDEVFADELAAR